MRTVAKLAWIWLGVTLGLIFLGLGVAQCAGVSGATTIIGGKNIDDADERLLA